MGRGLLDIGVLGCIVGDTLHHLCCSSEVPIEPLVNTELADSGIKFLQLGDR